MDVTGVHEGMDLAEFLNCTVGVTETEHTLEIGGVTHTMSVYELVEGDPIIAAIRTQVEAGGLRLRVWITGWIV
jgi:hypothetical protein